MNKKLLVVAFVACLAALSAVSRADMTTNLIVNGSFEATDTHPYTGNSNFGTLGAGSTAIDGWTVGGAGVDWIANYWKAAEGNYSIDMSALDPGVLISQKFATTVGQTYEVKFAIGANPERGPDPKNLNVSLDGGTTNVLFTAPIVVPQPNNPPPFNVGWVYRTLTFKAVDTTTTLTFTSGTFGPCGPTLDDVSVKAVPVPAAIMLGVMGLGLVGWARKRMA